VFKLDNLADRGTLFGYPDFEVAADSIILLGWRKEMHPIVTAIINKDINSIRALLAKDPGLKGIETEAGYSLYELAEKTGDYLILACVLRETKAQIKSAETVLCGILTTLSNDYFCAQYESSIEHFVWYCLENSGTWPPELGDIYSSIEPETIADIRYVVDQTGAWYSDDEGLMTVQKWQQRWILKD
jgi:hypothetical protein